MVANGQGDCNSEESSCYFSPFFPSFQNPEGEIPRGGNYKDEIMMEPNSNQTDEALAAQEWSMVLTANESSLKQVIRARTGEPQVVEDLFQQLALIACVRGDSLKEIVHLVPWFHRVAVVLSARHRRTMGRMRSKIERASNATKQPTSSTGLEILLNRERHVQTRHCIEALEPRDREILVLKYEERMSYRALAELLGITEKAVDRRLARAREKLRNQLNHLGVIERNE